MFTLTILFIVYNVSVEFVVIYRPHPVCHSIDRFGLIFAKTGSIKSGTVFNVYYLGEQMARGQQKKQAR